MNATPPLHILLADDDSEDQEMLREAIVDQAPNTNVSIVWNGAQVLSYLEDQEPETLPSLIILDYKMPILNAAETLDRVSGDSRYASIPIAVWSTSNQQEYIDNSLQKGALRFFTKPNSSRDLREIALTLLLLARAAR